MANALSPAKVTAVYLYAEDATALVVVPDYQLSLAIGREGQNARLAARLTKWRIDIKSRRSSPRSRPPSRPPTNAARATSTATPSVALRRSSPHRRWARCWVCPSARMAAAALPRVLPRLVGAIRPSVLSAFGGRRHCVSRSDVPPSSSSPRPPHPHPGERLSKVRLRTGQGDRVVQPGRHASAHRPRRGRALAQLHGLGRRRPEFRESLGKQRAGAGRRARSGRAGRPRSTTSAPWRSSPRSGPPTGSCRRTCARPRRPRPPWRRHPPPPHPESSATPAAALPRRSDPPSAPTTSAAATPRPRGRRPPSRRQSDPHARRPRPTRRSRGRDPVRLAGARRRPGPRRRVARAGVVRPAPVPGASPPRPRRAPRSRRASTAPAPPEVVEPEVPLGIPGSRAPAPAAPWPAHRAARARCRPPHGRAQVQPQRRARARAAA